VVLVTGPRQSGKTTLLRTERPDARYVSLDDPIERASAAEDPDGLLDEDPGRTLILDEIQYVPELLPRIKLRVDRDRDRFGRFLLSGSQQFGVMKGVSETLAGRVAILELLPLSLQELPAPDVATAVWLGGYPEPRLAPDKRDLWLRSYIATYVERDVRQLLNITDLRSFEHVVGLLAARHGQLENRAAVARQAGVTQPTVKAWTGVLEASYLVTRLEPFHSNYGKRLNKSPKVYFLDSALVCALTRQPSAEAAVAGAMRGELFEGLVIAEAVKAFAAGGRKPELWFWRSHDELEVDLLVQTPGGVVPVEVKLSATVQPGHYRALERFVQLAGGDVRPGLVVCRTPERRTLPDGHLALPWQEFPAWLAEQLGDPFG
jgi:predicted AAA+ superfamily ATPase